MFTYSSDASVIPTLTFTKAELAYTILFLLKDIPPTDNSSQIEMVEIRHYLNQIKEKVLMSTYDGSLKEAVSSFSNTSPKEQEDKPTPVKKDPSQILSMSELKSKFPNLSEHEIREIISSAKKDQMEKSKENTKPFPKPPESSSFIADKKPIHSTPSKQSVEPPRSTGSIDRHTENSKKFASLLGAF